MTSTASGSQAFGDSILEVLRTVDAIFGTSVSFVSRIDGEDFHILDAIDRDVMGFHPGQTLALRDTF